MVGYGAGVSAKKNRANANTYTSAMLYALCDFQREDIDDGEGKV